MTTSVHRAMEILDLLAGSEKPMHLSRIAEARDIPKSTAHSILKQLMAGRFVQLDDSGGYAVGLKAFEVGSAFVRGTGIVSVVLPQLASVTRELEMTSHYAVLDGTDAVYLCKEDPPRLGVQLASSIGARLPAHVTAVGKSCLAWLPESALGAHVAEATGRALSQAALARLAGELAEVRAQGYSTDDGATAAGIRCVAAPIFDLAGPVGALGVSYLGNSATDTGRIVDEVVRAAGRASERLGGTKP